jgi:predicted transposase YbfD/YdcC
VGALPVKGNDELKQTNETGMFIPVMESLDSSGKTITGDALLTQRKLAHYLVEDRLAHYVLIAKDNQPSLAEDIRLAFANRKALTIANPTPWRMVALSHARFGHLLY